MDGNTAITLSSEEICVLAGLLGYETVFGIHPPTLQTEDLHRAVRDIVEQLERKKLIRYDLDGTLSVAAAAEQCIACMCAAQTVGLFTTNIATGKTATAYVLEKNRFVTLVEELPDGRYRIGAADGTAVARLFPQQLQNAFAGSMREKLLLEEAACIKEQMLSFDSESARRHMEKCVNDAHSVPLLLQVLSGSCDYLCVQIYQRSRTAYDTVYHALIALPDGQAVCVSVDENDMVGFCSVDPAAVRAQAERTLGTDRGNIQQWKASL